MGNSNKLAIKAYEKVYTTIGAYLGYMNKALDNLEKEIKESGISYWKSRGAKSQIRRMRKAIKKQERDFTNAADELAPLMPIMDEYEFIKRCEEVRRIITPLFAKAVYQLKAINKVINLVKFTVKRKEA